MKLSDEHLESITRHLQELELIKKIDTILCEVYKIDNNSKHGTLNYTIYKIKDGIREGYITSFTLAEMPGCCGIVISTGASIGSKYRGYGLGTLLNNIRIELAIELGYSLLICTDILANEPQRKILKKNGWATLYQFNNQRTGNDISIDCLSLIERKEAK